MSMTAYIYSSVRSLARSLSLYLSPRTCGEKEGGESSSSSSENDTRPSGERESGSYSGTRQRNRIQFGPS